MTEALSAAPNQIAALLRQRILSGAYPDGMALRQEPLATELGCSRIPVREALRQLEAEGLVVSIPRRGAMVAEMPVDRIRESFELRSVIEPWLLTTSIPFMQEADFDAAARIIEEMEHMMIDGWGEANWRFHKALYAASGKAASLEMLEKIHESIDRYLRVHLRLTAGQDKARADHQLLLSLCKAKDIHRANALLTGHILDVADKLVESVAAARDLQGDKSNLHPALRARAR
ncbi:GntR family transcriptional regulator [Devosia neptuniae]|uniref:GntR family transcriptional regulator n=1 Tax=Devosia neptuniae TaxID=191302 RepID=UPI0022AFE76F|nr:GntR family transcriptional regulator [Devosia neptuniae]MCZ4345515.1 GntR family transcriptional regulator [Devosia neptuniae]